MRINDFYDGTPAVFLTNNRNYLQVDVDDSTESPRAWDNLGTLSIASNAFELFEGDLGKFGDFLSHYKVKQSGTDKEAMLRDIDSIVESAKKRGDVCLPVSVYDHGGISFYIGKPESQWDNYLVGFIYVTAERIREEYGGKRITKSVRDKVESVLSGEIDVLNDWENGNVWYYKLYNKEGDILDSCWGFYGDNALDDMESYFDEKIVKFLDNHRDIEYVIFKHQKGDYDL